MAWHGGIQLGLIVKYRLHMHLDIKLAFFFILSCSKTSLLLSFFFFLIPDQHERSPYPFTLPHVIGGFTLAYYFTDADARPCLLTV
jgi:hypothetical protein